MVCFLDFVQYDSGEGTQCVVAMVQEEIFSSSCAAAVLESINFPSDKKVSCITVWTWTAESGCSFLNTKGWATKLMKTIPFGETASLVTHFNVLVLWGNSERIPGLYCWWSWNPVGDQASWYQLHWRPCTPLSSARPHLSLLLTLIMS